MGDTLLLCKDEDIVRLILKKMRILGCASGHIDYDLAPFVKMSFYKHFNDGIKYLYPGINMNKYNDCYSINTSIEDNFYKSFDKAYKYAMDMTEKETLQAAQGLYHNLNTLESRPGR